MNVFYNIMDTKTEKSFGLDVLEIEYCITDMTQVCFANTRSFRDILCDKFHFTDGLIEYGTSPSCDKFLFQRKVCDA